MKELYINGRLVDLYPTTIIAQTLQIYDPGKIGSVTTNYTAIVKAPRTRNNDIIFQHLWNSKSKSEIPYASLVCKYHENGLPIIRNARIVVNDVQEDYSLTIYSGPWGFFEFIQQKTLWNLDFSDINGPWSASVRDGLRTATTGILQALVDDGRLVQDQASSAPTIENQGTTLKPPQIYYHTIIEKIFETAGYEYEGDIFTNDIFLKLAMPLSLIYNDAAWLERKMFTAAASGDQVIINPTVPVAVIFDTNIRQGSENFYNEVSEWVVNNTDTAAGYLRIRLRVNLTIEVTGGTVDIYVDGTDLTPSGAAEETNVGTGTYTLELDKSTGWKHGDVVKVLIVNNSGAPTVSVISGTFYTTTITGKEGFEFFPSIVEGYVYFEKLFEEILQIDFIRDFCVRFNVQITQINNKLVVNTLNRILDIRTGPNWTTKRDFRPDKIKWMFANYGRTNNIKAPVDDEFSPNLSDNYGDGSFQIPNENLKETLNIYTSLFAASEMISAFGVFMFHLNLGPDAANFARMPGKRLFFVRDKYDFEPPVLYDSVDRTDYKVGYYFDPDQEYNMSWEFFIQQFHQKYIDRCLRKVRLLERFYNLSDLDIFSFNQQVPIWDNGERFLVTKIINRVSKKKAKCELLKIEPNPEHFFVSGTANNITGDLDDTMEVMTDTVPPELEVRLELIESVTGNPTWQCTYDNTQDSVISTAIGNGGADTDVIDHVGEEDVDANVLKTNNDGNGPDGFPTADGWVEWLRNGVQVNTATFNTASPSSAQGLDYTYPDVKAFEILRVVIHEDGTSP